MPKKIDASLNEKLQNVQWGEYRIGDLFEVSTSKGYDAGKMKFVSKSTNRFEFIGRTRDNYGVQGFVEKLNTSPNNAETISVSQVGAVHAQIRKNKWYSSQNVFVLSPIYKKLINLLVVTAIDKVLVNYGGYSSYPTLQTLKDHIIQLPTKDSEIDFDFMDAYISELEEERISELSAYLTVSGLDNYELSSEEKEALEIYNDMVFNEYKFKDIFNNIKQGRRLKNDDQIIGNIPFVMSGRTNTGVVGYISNPIALFSKNSITIDIFGNSFYRNYDFGAGDDTGVYWNDEVQYSKETMLYFTTAMEKALFGKYSYGKKLRSSQSFNFKMQLPTQNNEIDFTYMELLISAVKKLVIKDVVLYADSKINATKKVISKN